jgi:hypothetical protein
LLLYGIARRSGPPLQDEPGAAYSQGVEPELASLIGMQVVEVGVRQAWAFATFEDLEGSAGQVRLFIDTDFEVTTPDGSGSVRGGEEPTSAMQALAGILNLTAVAATATDGELVVDLDGGVLKVSGVPSTWTTHDVWWLGDPHALCGVARP